ncbi:TetR/AcrR family transcriptional regulator [Desulfosporosinus sp. OT]|uniref:TetR/AcrR family transcriptional regulator n=1 Tax=Desulfosporosinus sp. OT TaxID=913865 RepID=UPI000223ACB9|nr:TetR/AcrR family transcriptional regulator [Desulfosporosinus sp. OT]EGW36992.1 bacterial regulatory s, tetR family protein [Desulfosporosinus sp. OT]
MARIADPEKLENIKIAVMELLVEHGYGGMSIVSVSEKAGVSPGYLYKHYSSKEELVQELVETEMDSIIENLKFNISTSSSVYEAAYKTVYNLFMYANSHPINAKFTAAVFLDVKVPSMEKVENYKILVELAKQIIDLGIKTKEFSPQTTPIEVVAIAFTIPFNYISICLEVDKEKKFTPEEAKRITKICIRGFT